MFDVDSVNDNVFDVAGKEEQFPTDQLRVMLKNQLEYYFSR